MQKNVANQTVNFQMILKASGDDSGDLSGTASIEVNVDKVGFVAGVGVLKFLSNGTHEYTPTQAETNGDYVAFRLRETTAITALVQTYPIVQDDYKADVTNLDATVSSRMPTTHINATAGKVDGVALVDTTTTNTDMRGTDGASTHTAADAGTDAAAKVLATPANKLATDAGGAVTTTTASQNASKADLTTVETELGKVIKSGETTQYVQGTVTSNTNVQVTKTRV